MKALVWIFALLGSRPLIVALLAFIETRKGKARAEEGVQETKEEFDINKTSELLHRFCALKAMRHAEEFKDMTIAGFELENRRN